MRVYIINADDLIVSCEAPARPGENEIVVASLDELHAARLNGKRLLAGGRTAGRDDGAGAGMDDGTRSCAHRDTNIRGFSRALVFLGLVLEQMPEPALVALPGIQVVGR